MHNLKVPGIEFSQYSASTTLSNGKINLLDALLKKFGSNERQNSINSFIRYVVGAKSF